MKAIQKARQLPEAEQKALAKLLEDELQWSETFRKTQKELDTLAQEALKEYRACKTQSGAW